MRLDVCFFFFQAEDGIRDYKVTGVQTCALPILLTEYSPAHHKHQTGLYWGFTRLNGRDFFHNPQGDYWRRVSAARSEERRVGKEGGQRGARYGWYGKRRRRAQREKRAWARGGVA